MFYDECTIEEVLAYRALENEYFDFGEGLMSPLSNSKSEDVYYKMRIQWEEEFMLEQKSINHNKKRKKKRLNHYARKQIDKFKIDKLSKVNWWTVEDKGTHKARCYYSRRKTVIKKISNKKVRKHKDLGNYSSYRKVHNYWHELF